MRTATGRRGCRRRSARRRPRRRRARRRSAPGSRWPNGRMALNRWVTYGACGEAAANSLGAAIGVADRDDDAAPASSAMTSVRPAAPGPPSPAPRRRPRPAVDQPRRGTQGLRRWAPRARAPASDPRGAGRAAPLPPSPPVGDPRRQRGRPPARGARDDGRQERRHPVAGRSGAELVDALRLGRHVDAVGAVDLHVDEAGHDPAAAGVDVDGNRSTGDAAIDQPSVRPDAAGDEHAVGRDARARPPTITRTSPRRRLSPAAPRLPRGTSAGEHDAAGEVRGRPASAMPPLRWQHLRQLHAERRERRVIPPPTATTSTSSAITHSCTAHAVATTTSSSARLVDHRASPIRRLGATDLPASAPRCTRRIRHVADLAGTPDEPAPHAAGEHEAGGDPRADVDVRQRLRRRQLGGGRTHRGGGVDVVLQVHGRPNLGRRRAGDVDRTVDAEVDRRADRRRRVVDATGHPDGDGGRCPVDPANEVSDPRSTMAVAP